MFDENSGKDVYWGEAGMDFFTERPESEGVSADEFHGGGVDLVYGEDGDDKLTGGGIDTDDRYVLDGGANTAVGDTCVPLYPGSGELVDCER